MKTLKFLFVATLFVFALTSCTKTVKPPDSFYTMYNGETVNLAEVVHVSLLFTEPTYFEVTYVSGVKTYKASKIYTAEQVAEGRGKFIAAILIYQKTIPKS